MANRFEERYQAGDVPWDRGTPDDNLVNIVRNRPVQPCHALEIGCGTGDNTVWLAQQGFGVTACDLSQTAVEQARQKATAARAQCSFEVADFLEAKISGMPFGFAFDRGCLHSIDTQEGRKQFARNVAAHLEAKSLWLTLVGNADGPSRETGPPRMTAEELVSVVEPSFEVLSLAAGHFGGKQANPPEAWICLLRKREK